VAGAPAAGTSEYRDGPQYIVGAGLEGRSSRTVTPALGASQLSQQLLDVLLMLLVVTRDGYTEAGWAALGLHHAGVRASLLIKQRGAQITSAAIRDVITAVRTQLPLTP